MITKETKIEILFWHFLWRLQSVQIFPHEILFDCKFKEYLLNRKIYFMNKIIEVLR